MTLVITNQNVYSISLAGMQLNGTIDFQNPANEFSYNQTVGALFIPASSTTEQRLPIDFVVPRTINVAALTTDITLLCIKGLNKITTLVQGTAFVNVLGHVLPFSFGPEQVQSTCL